VKTKHLATLTRPLRDAKIFLGCWGRGGGGERGGEDPKTADEKSSSVLPGPDHFSQSNNEYFRKTVIKIQKIFCYFS